MFFSCSKGYPIMVSSVIHYKPQEEQAKRARQKRIDERGAEAFQIPKRCVAGAWVFLPQPPPPIARLPLPPPRPVPGTAAFFSAAVIVAGSILASSPGCSKIPASQWGFFRKGSEYSGALFFFRSALFLHPEPGIEKISARRNIP